jgi:hypothetical protein
MTRDNHDDQSVVVFVLGTAWHYFWQHHILWWSALLYWHLFFFDNRHSRSAEWWSLFYIELRQK